LKIFWTVSRKVTPTCNLWEYSADNSASDDNALCWKALISLSEDFSIPFSLVKIALGQFPPPQRASVFLCQYHSTKAYFSYFIIFHQPYIILATGTVIK